jgi:hypothetical protein
MYGRNQQLALLSHSLYASKMNFRMHSYLESPLGVLHADTTVELSIELFDFRKTHLCFVHVRCCRPLYRLLRRNYIGDDKSYLRTLFWRKTGHHESIRHDEKLNNASAPPSAAFFTRLLCTHES